MKFNINTVGCPTLSVLNEKHKLELPETPTNVTHSEFMCNLKSVEGITNHGSLFSAQESIDPQDDEDLEEKLKHRNYKLVKELEQFCKNIKKQNSESVNLTMRFRLKIAEVFSATLRS